MGCLTSIIFYNFSSFPDLSFVGNPQIMICVGLLLLTEILYRFTNIPGFDQPFTDQHNFGNYTDLLLMNKINKDGWVAINCIPTAVHTIAGALAGKLLLTGKEKIKPLLIWVVICLIVGYGLDIAGITPIIKRIATSSFTLASLGWCLLGLTACYWWIDVKGHKKYLKFFIVISMNSIFIYLFFEILGGWFNRYVGIATNGLMGFINTPKILAYYHFALYFHIGMAVVLFLIQEKIFLSFDI